MPNATSRQVERDNNRDNNEDVILKSRKCLALRCFGLSVQQKAMRIRSMQEGFQMI